MLTLEVVRAAVGSSCHLTFRQTARDGDSPPTPKESPATTKTGTCTVETSPPPPPPPKLKAAPPTKKEKDQYLEYALVASGAGATAGVAGLALIEFPPAAAVCINRESLFGCRQRLRSGPGRPGKDRVRRARRRAPVAHDRGAAREAVLSGARATDRRAVEQEPEPLESLGAIRGEHEPAVEAEKPEASPLPRREHDRDPAAAGEQLRAHR